uniref:Uncharacterized protein n=1 Tax=Ditylum brightwellii TaxID=49249 RepID=A0A6U3NLR6_9STRA
MSNEQLEEYESQLSELNTLLEEDPNDESILQLKHDLLELIRLTKSESSSSSTTTEAVAATTEVTTEEDPKEEEDVLQMNEDSSPEEAVVSNTETTTSTAKTTKKSIKKKSKTSKHTTLPTTFEVPTHLIPLDSDTAAEKNRKRRTIKALKSKFKARQKTIVTEEKQKSWHDFMKKSSVEKKTKKKKSIFATEEGVHAKVGVISGGGEARRVTEFGERKRHK